MTKKEELVRDIHDHDSHENIVPSEPTEIHTLKREVDSNQNSESKINARQYLRGLGFFAILIISVLFQTFIYVTLHGINILDRALKPQNPIVFDYIGGNATPFSIGLEILFWSLVGVICHIAYLSGQAVLEKRFEFGEYLIRWISTSMYAAGIAHAVVFLLRLITIKIANIEITLKDAPVEVIIAISFILGFYYQEARKLLDKLRGQITNER